MNTPNPVIYEFCRSAWEKYRREEDLPVQSLPAGQQPDPAHRMVNHVPVGY